MLDLLSTARTIADCIRGEVAVPMPVIAGEIDAGAGPFKLKGFHENFIVPAGTDTRHLVFAYNQAASDTLDPNAQYHLQQFTGQALRFNLYCQRAQLDEALTVALQSPDVPPMIDCLLVRSAFFAAFFDNMLAVMGPEGGQPVVPEADKLHASLSRYMLRARDKMFNPDRLDLLLPLKIWPFIGCARPVLPHEGDYFINGVYFPAEHARLLLDAREGNATDLRAVA